MGLMRFVSVLDCITEEMVQQAYMSGYDRIPWRIRARQVNGELRLERTISDSGALHIPWPVEGHGQVTLSTGTLMERPEPYRLPLELARGKLGQLRNQMAEWQTLGLAVSDEVLQKVSEATGYFSRAICGSPDSPRSVELVDQTIRVTLDAAELLTDGYIEQALMIRRHASPGLSTFLGADLGTSLLDESTSVEFLETFNAACAPMMWREIEGSQGKYYWNICDHQVEWSGAHGLTLCAGPLLQFDQRRLPDWLTLYEGDFESLFSFSSQFVRTVVERYRGKVDIWLCAAQMNTADVLSLSEEEKIRLVARAVELTRALDPNTPLVVSFDQPWAEYLSRREMDFSPLHFADALVRAGLGMTGLMLEINVGYCPGGTLPRDPLEFNRQLDYWSLLGVPLFLSLSVPSSCRDDPLATRGARVWPDGWNAEAQQAWVERYLPLFLAKQYVQGILWNQLRDCEPHDFSHAGLFDAGRQPKPALRQLASIRKAYLR